MQLQDCIFCKIVQGRVPANFEYKGENVVVFTDIKPAAPIHLLIVPKKHIAEFATIGNEDKSMWDEMIRIAHKLIEKHGLRKRGYRLVMNGGPAALVPHLHMHLLGELGAKPPV